LEVSATGDQLRVTAWTDAVAVKPEGAGRLRVLVVIAEEELEAPSPGMALTEKLYWVPLASPSTV
jgi:hypothetical protein